MKKFIRKNWFKVVIDLVLLLINEPLDNKENTTIKENNIIKNAKTVKNITVESKKISIQEESSKVATTSFIFGVLSIFFGSIGMIPLLALILGIISMTRFKGIKTSSKVFAIIGLILGAVYFTIHFLVDSVSGPQLLK